MKVAFTPTEIISILTQLHNMEVNGTKVFRKVELEDTAITGRMRLVIENYDTTANLEFIVSALPEQQERT